MNELTHGSLSSLSIWMADSTASTDLSRFFSTMELLGAGGEQEEINLFAR